MSRTTFPCPNNRKDCSLVYNGGTTTLLHSPVVYDLNGKPIGGGSNKVTSSAGCINCGTHFLECRTELERAQGVAPNWTPVERR